MDKQCTLCSPRYHLDNAFYSNCSEKIDALHRIGKNQQESHRHYHLNNHNSGLIRQDRLIKSKSATVPKRRRIKTSSKHYRLQTWLLSILVILIRFVLLLILGLILYYVFVSIYPKSQTNRWERLWYNTIGWLTKG